MRHNFTTPRLLIRLLASGDKASFCQLYTNTKVMKFTGGAFTSRLAKQQFQRSVNANQKAINGEMSPVLTWVIICKKEQVIIGIQTISFLIQPYNKNVIEDTHQSEMKQADLSIVLSTRVQRKGLAKEALLTLFEFGFNYLSLDRLNVFYEKNNDASRKLFSHLNFNSESKQYSLISDYEYKYINASDTKPLKFF